LLQLNKQKGEENSMEGGCHSMAGLWQQSQGNPTMSGWVRRTVLKTTVYKSPPMSNERGMVSFIMKPDDEVAPSAKKTGLGEARG
jgi:hypothetical protein